MQFKLKEEIISFRIEISRKRVRIWSFVSWKTLNVMI